MEACRGECRNHPSVLSGRLRQNSLEWIVFTPVYMCLVIRAGIGQSYTLLPYEELFRLGFRFSLYRPDGTLFKEYSELDLPENLRQWWIKQYPGLANIPPAPSKTVEEIFANPYGVMSFPPTLGYPRIEPSAANNDHVLCWWLEPHDELIQRRIRRDGWNWWPSTSAL
jgi:hypothetical protein